MKIMYLQEELNKIEREIVEEYEKGVSIRKLAEKYKSKGYGRTKINNIIKKYVLLHPEQEENVKNQMLKNRFHKKDENVEVVELTEEQIARAYEDIKNGTTLTQVAKAYEKTRDYLKNRILEYINNEAEEKEFLYILKSNQKPQRKDDFLEMSETEKKKVLFERLNKRRILNNRKAYTEKHLEKKYQRLRRYLLEVRNNNIPEEDRLTEDDFFKILYDTPTLLSSSLTNRIIPALENLDYHSDIGIKNATHMIKEDASILLSSIARTNLQIKILKDNDLLKVCFEKPRTFRTSPELMYGLIEFHKERKKSNSKDSQIFITKSKLKEMYGYTKEDLEKRYNLQSKYGNDEYFEGK